MGIICDGCGKKIPYGCIDKIELTLYGKLGKIARELIGDDKLVFDSIKCFEDYKFPKTEGNQ